LHHPSRIAKLYADHINGKSLPHNGALVSIERLQFPKEIELPYDEATFVRSALVACLADDECRIAGVPDTYPAGAVLDFVSGIGYTVEKIDESQVNITGRGYAKPSEPPDAVDCAGSVDLAHVFAAFMTGFGLYGAIRCSNPFHSLRGLASTVRSMGGDMLGRGDGCTPPWCVHPMPLSNTDARPSNPHPSLRSALVMLFLLGQGTSSIPSTMPGHDGAERAIGHYRGEIRRSEGKLFIKGGERIIARRREMPRSFRMAVVAGCATAVASARPVKFPGVCLNPTRAATLEHLGHAGIGFDVAKLTDLDGEIAGDLLINPAEPKGLELGRDAVRASCEDLGPLLTIACLSDGLSEFDLASLTEPEANGTVTLAREIASAVKSEIDTEGNKITIEGNPSPAADAEALANISDYPSRAILAIALKTPAALDKQRCLSEFGKSLTQVILGDLLF
jgi:3-phosphoshikimate 1-carboxyvinyltransferase